MRRNLLLCSLLLAGTAPAAENVAIVLDASGSMWGQIHGRTKIEIAREAVGRMVEGWEADNAIALIAYGHRRKGDCADIQTLIPLGPLQRQAFMDVVNSLNPKGMTPLSQAVIDAADALKSSEQKATVILVSDGEETCNLDPCAVGAELESRGVDFTAHVIGFDVQDPTHQAQLRCLAENTGGRYFNARDSQELGRAVQGAVVASTEPPAPPASATLKPLGTARITQPLTVAWSGPADEGDFITVVRPEDPDSRYLTYAYVPEVSGEGRGELSFEMPAQAGSYELRYVSPSRRDSVLVRLPLEVADAEAAIEAPASAVAGTEIAVRAKGPVAGGHWIGFAPKGSGPGTYLSNHYERPNGPHSELRLKVPGEPGEYELRYVLNENERVIASRPIRVEAGAVAVSGPVEVMAGDRVTIQAAGPTGNGHWVGFAPAGSRAGVYVGNAYFRPESSEGSGTVVAPSNPGEYEYRYVLFEGETVAASMPVKVLPAQVTLRSPDAVAVGMMFEVDFTGPRGDGHWIGIVPAGGDGSEYQDWGSVPEQGDRLQLRAPEDAGSWEVVFVMDNRVVARQPLRVE